MCYLFAGNQMVESLKGCSIFLLGQPVIIYENDNVCIVGRFSEKEETSLLNNTDSDLRKFLKDQDYEPALGRSARINTEED